MNFYRFDTIKRRRGALLVAVLGFILILTIFATQFLSAVFDDLRYKSQMRPSLSIERVAADAFEVILAVLNEWREIDGHLYAPAQGWNDVCACAPFLNNGDDKIEIILDDEGGKLPVRSLNETILSAFLQVLNVSNIDAKRLSDALAPYLAKTTTPATLYSRTSALTGGALENFELLLTIPEWRDFLIDPESKLPNIYFERFCKAFSLYSDNNVINVNTANNDVLQVLAKWTSLALNDLQAYLQHADTPFFKEKNAVPAQVSAANSGPLDYDVYCRMLYVTIKLSRGDTVCTRRWLVRIQGKDDAPFDVLALTKSAQS